MEYNFFGTTVQGGTIGCYQIGRFLRPSEKTLREQTSLDQVDLSTGIHEDTNDSTFLISRACKDIYAQLFVVFGNLRLVIMYIQQNIRVGLFRWRRD